MEGILPNFSFRNLDILWKLVRISGIISISVYVFLLLLSHFSRVQLCVTHRRQPTRLPRPWDSSGKKTGVGCHFLLQCVKVKSESEVAQSCPTLIDPMDCSPPGSSVHGIFQARVLEWGAIAFSTALGKVKVKLLSRVRLFTTPWTAATRLLRPWDFSGKSIGVGCHHLL